jgi:predicted ATPase
VAEVRAAVSHIAEPEVMGLLTRLVEKSLVVYEEDEQGLGRYRLLETVRLYASGRLAESRDTAAVRERFRCYFLHLAEETALHLSGPDERLEIERLESERENLRAALEGSREDEEGKAGPRLAMALRRFWGTRGYLSEGRQWLEGFLALPLPDATVETARAFNAAGHLALMQSDFAAAHAYFEE